MKIEKLVRTCAEAWCEDDIQKVLTLYDCPNELLVNNTDSEDSFAAQFTQFYNRQTHLQELYEAYLDICKDTVCYFYDFPYIGEDHVIFEPLVIAVAGVVVHLRGVDTGIDRAGDQGG